MAAATSGTSLGPNLANPCSASEQLLLSTLSVSPHDFLQPPPSLHTASLSLAKHYLDPIALSASRFQAQRHLHGTKKRKRGGAEVHDTQSMLRLKQIHTQGLGIEQIWEQAKRVLYANREELALSMAGPSSHSQGQGKLAKKDAVQSEEKPLASVSANGGALTGENSSANDSGEPGEHECASDEDAGDKMLYDAGEVGVDCEDDIKSESVEGADGLGNAFKGEGNKLSAQQSEALVPDKHGLNDGFFSIDDFNRQSELLEQQDAHGDPNDGVTSDEEIVDWGTDPSSLVVRQNPTPAQDSADDVDSHTSSGDSDPTFDIINTRTGDSDDCSQTSAPMDDESFEDSRAYPDIQSAASPTLPREASAEVDDQRIISSVRRDLFEDESDMSLDNEQADSYDRRSSHQKRQAALAAEIRRLEASAVAKRDWLLSGEIRAVDRPPNALLGEDLDFERVGKPVPVITNEVNEDIESLIKRRIQARDFDEVIRRRPSNLVTGAVQNVRRGAFELDDSRPQQSLAKLYEEEHLNGVDPNRYTSKHDLQIKIQQEEIETLWSQVCSRLDSLSSWHYRPKPPDTTINVVSDVPAITVEDAQPTAGADAVTTRLAPQEVYKAGEGANKRREVVTKTGEVVGRDELRREERRRRRRREKERIRKASGGTIGKVEHVESRGKREQKEAVAQLQRAGVTFISQDGRARNIYGEEAKGDTVPKAGQYKL